MKQGDDAPDDSIVGQKRRSPGGKGDTGGTDEQLARGRSVNQTALRLERIDPEQVYRIAVIGLWLKPRVLPGVLDDAYGRIFDDHNGPRIALHAGQVFIKGVSWPMGTDELREAAAKHQVAALFEIGQGSDRVYMAFEPREGLLPVRIYQRFADSSQADANPAMVAGLVEDCGLDRERTINLAGLRVGLLVCGENNVFTNEQGNGNRTLVRHQPDAHIFEHLRVMFNGAHTTMGNWGKLDQRFKYLSRERRWAFYATNTNNDNWGRSTVRGYYDGNMVADSSGRMEGVPEGVIVQSIADMSKERYLALVFDIPGRLLMAH